MKKVSRLFLLLIITAALFACDNSELEQQLQDGQFEAVEKTEKRENLFNEFIEKGWLVEIAEEEVPFEIEELAAEEKDEQNESVDSGKVYQFISKEKAEEYSGLLGEEDNQESTSSEFVVPSRRASTFKRSMKMRVSRYPGRYQIPSGFKNIHYTVKVSTSTQVPAGTQVTAVRLLCASQKNSKVQYHYPNPNGTVYTNNGTSDRYAYQVKYFHIYRSWKYWNQTQRFSGWAYWYDNYRAKIRIYK
ncbi:MAG: hypothetical protein GY754_20540 [bacterium]|nr:hypothetical protein [bacterium]